MFVGSYRASFKDDLCCKAFDLVKYVGFGFITGVNK